MVPSITGPLPWVPHTQQAHVSKALCGSPPWRTPAACFYTDMGKLISVSSLPPHSRSRTCGQPSPQMLLATLTTRTSATSSHTEKRRKSSKSALKELKKEDIPCYPTPPHPPLPIFSSPPSSQCAPVPRSLLSSTKTCLVQTTCILREATGPCGVFVCLLMGNWDYFQ